MATMKLSTRTLWPVLLSVAAVAGVSCGDGGDGANANDPPSASFAFSCIQMNCVFDGRASSDADGNIASYSWTFGDGAVAAGETASHIYESAGTRTVTLTVTDDDGATDSESRSVTVAEGQGTIPPVLEYALYTDGSLPPLVIEAPLGDNVVLELSGLIFAPFLAGELDTETGNFTIEPGVGLRVSESNDPVQLFGTFEVAVDETFDIPVDSLPVGGGLYVDSFAPLFLGRVLVDVLPAGAGLRLSLDQGTNGTIEAQVELTWAEFDELLGSAAPQWQQLGAFGYVALIEFVPELMEYGLGGALLAVTLEDLLPVVSPVTAPCEAFSAAGLSVPPPPPVIPDQGFETFTWFDDAASGDVSTGDSFSLAFDYCLLYFGDEDAVMNNGLFRMINWSHFFTNNVLTQVWFQGIFEDFEIWAVWDADGGGPGTASVAELEARVNGPLVLLLTAP